MTFTAVLLFVTLSSIAQDRNWTTKETKDGKSIVKYDLVKEDKRTHFYYIAETTLEVTLDELDATISNTENHKIFLDNTPITEEFQRISDSEWLAYYFMDAPWPIPNCDIVINFHRERTDNKLIFTATAIEHDYKKSDTKRMTDYKVVYEFEKIDDTTSKIIYNADYIPYGRVPKFLIKSWFPNGPAGIVAKIGAIATR